MIKTGFKRGLSRKHAGNCSAEMKRNGRVSTRKQAPPFTNLQPTRGEVISMIPVFNAAALWQRGMLAIKRGEVE